MAADEAVEGVAPEPTAVGGDVRPPPWRLRFLVVEALLLPAVGLLACGLLWPAAVWGSVVCCAGTDSGWRWRNRLLVLQAVLWLLVPLVLGS